MRYAFNSLNALWYSSVHSNAFILVVHFLVIVHRGTAVVAFAAALFVILMVQILFVPLAQLLLQQLSKALGGFSISWLMVAIGHLDHATLCLRSGDMADHSFSHRRHQLMMPRIVNKSHSFHVLETTPVKQKQKQQKKKTLGEYRCGTGQRPSKC